MPGVTEQVTRDGTAPDEPDEIGSAAVARTLPRVDLVGRVRDELAARWPAWQDHLPIVTVVGLYVWYFTRMSMDVHRGLGTSGYDFGLYDQGLWLLSRFKAPYVTIMGRNLMGDHTSFILVLLVPLYWIAPGAWILLFSQAAAIGSGAFVVYALARRKIGGVALPTLLGALYLGHPALSWTNMEQFHPDAYLGLLVPLAIYAAVCRRTRLFVVAAALCLLVKEDAAFIVLPLGLWVAWRRDRRLGLWMAGAAFAYALFATQFVLRSLIGRPTLNSWRIPFGGPRGTLRAVVDRPGEVFDYLKADHRPFYVWQMLLPYLPGFVWAPDIAAISTLVLASNVVSTFVYQHLIQYHYSLAIVPALAMASVVGVARLAGRRRVVVVALVTVLTAWSAHLWSVLPGSRNVYAHWPATFPVPVEVRELAKYLPPDAVVSATHNFVPQIDRRERIYQFPTPFSARLWGVYDREGQQLPFVDDIEYVFITNDLLDLQPIWDRFKDRYEPLVQGRYATIYVRKGLPHVPVAPPGVTIDTPQPTASTP
jgi:uncharacterized membrane protein